MSYSDLGVETSLKRNSQVSAPFQSSDFNIDNLVDEYENNSDSAVVAITSEPQVIIRPDDSSSSADAQSQTKVLIMQSGPEETSPLKETHHDPFSTPRCLRYANSLCIFITTLSIAALSVTIALVIQVTTGVTQLTPHGAVHTSDETCSKQSLEILKNTDVSSSTDAAVFAALCLCVTQPHVASIGGGGFAIFHDQKVISKATHAFDFREVSPMLLSDQAFVAGNFTGKNRSEVLPQITVAVPGLLKGLYALHKQHGKMSWKSVVDKVVDLAVSGVSVSADLAKAIETTDLTSVPPDLQKLITTTVNGITRKLKKGDVLKQPKLAEVLKIIGDNGVDVFYSGNLGRNFTNSIRDLDGILTLDDMSSYNVTDYFELNETKLNHMNIATARSPSFGPVLHAVLSTMEKYKPLSSDRELQMHRLVESLKYSFAMQSEMGDPSRDNYSSIAYHSFNESYDVGTAIRAKINDNRSFDIAHYLNNFQPVEVSSGGQQQVSVIGWDRTIITISLTLGSQFGSKLMALGFVLNDAVLDFSWEGKNVNPAGLQVSKTNFLSGGLRPLSSLVPAVVVPSGSKCDDYVAMSSEPGYRSGSSLAQVILDIAIKTGYMQSVVNPRLHQQLVPNTVFVESTERPELVKFLKEKGHNVTRLAQNVSIGVVDLLLWRTAGISTVDDQRSSQNDLSLSF